MVIGLVFTACDPMDEINASIDAQEDVIVGDANYTLTDDDYSDLNLDGGFESVDDVKSMIPNFLTDKYPVWGKGSSVLLNYNMIGGLTDLDGVTNYINADSYYFNNEDYPGYSQNAFAFFPDENPADALANIFPEAEDGDIVLAKYRQYTQEPVTGIVEYFNAGFNGTLAPFEAVSVVGSQEWYDSSYSGVEYAKMTGYSGGTRNDNEDWLISPEIDLTSQTNLTLQVNQAINYANDISLLSVLVSTDYDELGDPSTANWDLIEFTNSPAGDNWNFVLSEEYDLTAYEGETIHIAFKYISSATTNDASTWEVDSAVIKTPGVEGDTMFKEVYYKFNGSDWEAVNDAYYLNSVDYDSMGEASGQPGNYNNFDSNVAPNNYIPAFLALEYPFAQEEDALIVMYKYRYNHNTIVRGNLYTVINGIWVAHSTSLQFGHDGITWVPDNTIKYTLTGADYAYMADQLTGNADFDNVSLPNLGSYGDFDYNWTDAQVLQALGILADNLNPTAEEGQKYIFTYLLYDNGLNTLSINIIKTNGVWVLNN